MPQPAATPTPTPDSTPQAATAPASGKTANYEQILKLEVPVVVRLGEKHMPLREIVRFNPGSIIELPKNADSDLDLLVNNRPIARGSAVKVGENFGLRINVVGDVHERIEALGPAKPQTGSTAAPEPDEPDPAVVAAAME